MERTGYDNTDHGPDEPRLQRVACDGYRGDTTPRTVQEHTGNRW